MTKVRHDRMMWFDIETSDTDENAPHAALLEVGITVTDDAGRIVSEKNFINELTRYQKEKIHAWPVEVLQMHMANGLYKEVMEQHYDGNDIEGEVLIWLDSETNYSEAMDGPPLERDELILLAGSGVSHFDRRWAKKFLRQIEQNYWTHFAIDVGVMRRMLEMHSPQLAARARHISARGVSAPAHRALDCNRRSIQTYQYYIKVIRDLGRKAEWIECPSCDDSWASHVAGMHSEETAPPTADVQRDSQHQSGARLRAAADQLCRSIGPGDTCTYVLGHQGGHSWE